MGVSVPEVRGFLHKPSSTISYIVADRDAGVAAVVDPPLDFDLSSGRLGTAPLDPIVAALGDMGLSLEWILETHVHADHVSGAAVLKDRLGGRIGIGQGITKVQRTFAAIYDEAPGFAVDGSQFDHLFADGERFAIGGLSVVAMATPGHTPACTSYHVGDAVFVGDTVFMPDFGTARCDFPGGSAKLLFASVRRLLELPADTRVFVGHDYGPGGREIAWQTSIAGGRRENKHVRDDITEAEFVAMREERDAQLGLPGLIIPAIQINIRAGRLPEPAANGVSYLKVPVNGFPGA